jgi:tetratricopeptide (TPR) repeat protein
LKTLTVLIFTILFQLAASGQSVGLNAHEWAKKLADPSDKENKASFFLDSLLLRKPDSITVMYFLDQLDKQSPAKGHYFTARYNCLKAKVLRKFNPPQPVFSTFVNDSIKRQVTQLLEQAMQQAFIVDDDYLAAYVSSVYGNAMAAFRNTEKAVMYMMYSAELYQKVGLFAKYPLYYVLGEMLWRVREYQKSIEYSKTAISLWLASGDIFTTRYVMMCNNTIALSYHRMKNYDSALFYYNKALQLSSQVKDKETGREWNGIISGNMAQIDYAQGKYAEALPKFESEYQTSRENEAYDDAANSVQWAAKTNLALGNKTVALRQIRASFRLLQKWPHADNYRQNAYQTAAEIFKALGNDDSAYYYSGKYNILHDSIEKNIYQSSISISELRLNNEKNRLNIQKL